MLAEIQLNSVQIMWHTGVEAIPYLTGKAKKNNMQMGVISLMVGHEIVQKVVSLYYIIMRNTIFIINFFPVTLWYCSSSAKNAIIFIDIMELTCTPKDTLSLKKKSTLMCIFMIHCSSAQDVGRLTEILSRALIDQLTSIFKQKNDHGSVYYMMVSKAKMFKL